MNESSENRQASPWAADWEVSIRIWVQRHGQTVLGEGGCDLLAAIDRTSSISAAARMLGISYRHAWMLVQEANAAAGEPLVAAAVGGLGGGGAQLTPRGKLSLEVFENLRDSVRATAAGLVQKIVSPTVDLSATVHLAAAISLQEVVGQLLTEYALRQPGVPVRAVFGASNELADHILAGAPCDLFLSADATHLDHLAAGDLIQLSSRQVLATNSLVVLGPKGGGRSIRNVRDLLAPRVKQIALADPAAPLGKCSRAYLQALGYYDLLVSKAVHVDNSRAILAAIASGRAQAALAFASDAARSSDCEILFAIEPTAAAITYSAAVIRGGRREKDAQSLLDFFATTSARQCFRRCGLTVPGVRGSTLPE